MGYYLNQTNILKAYAGFLIDDEELLTVSSGGVASVLAKIIIERGGIVYGAVYSSDFHSANFMRAKDEPELCEFKGSKYCYVNKYIVINGEHKSVFDAICEDLCDGKEVMFVGLGCDIAVLNRYCHNKNIPDDKLLMVELLCDGVTEEIVHREYIEQIEHIHQSELIGFSVRNKKDGWVPIYIHAQFKNGDEHIVPFYETPYGFSFAHYKKRACYNCKFKVKNHYGDLIIGDYRGCEPSMPEYNKNGVSIIYVQSQKGESYINDINPENFSIMETDAEYALRHSPRYFSPHPYNVNWNSYHETLKTKGLFGIMAECFGLNSKEQVHRLHDKEIVMWGAGGCFHKLAPYVMEYLSVSCVVDKDSQKWEKKTEYEIICHAPSYIKNRNVFVIIMIEDAAVSCQIINTLLAMNIESFDNVYNLIRTFDIREYNMGSNQDIIQ